MAMKRILTWVRTSYTRRRAKYLAAFARLDKCEQKALASLPPPFLKSIASVAKRYAAAGHKNDQKQSLAVVSLLSSKEELSRKLAAMKGKTLVDTINTLVGSQSSALEAARKEGAFSRVSNAIYEQLEPALRSKLPGHCTLLATSCQAALAHQMERGWMPDLAAMIFLQKFAESPRSYVHIEPQIRHDVFSAAPQRVSRSECRR